MPDALAALLDPKSVAVIGASHDPDKVGGRPIAFLRRFGFKGDIFPVNPSRPTVQGLRAYRHIEEVEAVPDAAILAVDGLSAAEQVARCAARGVKVAVVMSSGFAELGPEGRERERQLLAAARRGGMRLVGPNAQGSANFSNGAVLNFSTVFTDVEPKDGPIAIVGQSGAASVMPFALLREAGYGVRYVIATGNDVDLTACALAEVVAADEDVRIILVYLESVREPERLANAAAIARRRGAYLLVLKGGTSRKGAAAAASHTGALVGDDDAVETFLARHGIYRARDVEDFVRATALYLDNRPTGGGRAVAMSYSGAVAVMTADLAERHALELAELAAATTSALTQALPGFATPNNPLDMTAGILGNPQVFPSTLAIMGDDPEADVVMVTIPVAGTGYDVDGFAKASAEFASTRNKPLVASAAQGSVRRAFRAHGVPTFETEADAVRALSQYTRHHALMRAPAPDPARRRAVPDLSASSPLSSGPLSSSPLSSGPLSSGPLPAGVLDEPDSLSLLARHGLPVAPHMVCRSPEAAAAAFAALGVGRAVVKGCAAAIPHKSDLGLVHLRIGSAAAAAEAARRCLDVLRAQRVSDARVVVAAMIEGGHEFALGVCVDPMLGPLVMIADGGTLIELRRDVACLMAPFTVEAAATACARLRLAPLFRGYRNAPPLDLAALAGAAAALGDFAVAARGTLKAVDVNPVIVLPEGRGAFAVDAVVAFH